MLGRCQCFPKMPNTFVTKKAADEIAGAGLPACTTKVGNDGYKLKIDNEHMIQLDYHGPIHTEGNLYLWIPYYKLLMLADFVFPQWGPYANLGMQASLVQYSQAFDVVLAYDFEYYVGGHVDRVGSRQDVNLGRQFWNDLVSTVKEGYQTVQLQPIVDANGGFNGTNTFTIYRAYSNAVDKYCIDKMLNDLGWSTKLIDAAAYMETHCFLVYEYVGINY